MLHARENVEIRQSGEGWVAVAVDKEKCSQFALKWTIDNLFPRSKPLKLVHVVQRSPPTRSNPGVAGAQQLESDPQAMQVLLPYRCYCSRRQVQFEIVLLYDTDVTRALTNYASSDGIDKLILGTKSKHGLSRIFKNSDVSSSVLKSASKFCDVYVISKGKVSAMRRASRSRRVNNAVQITGSIYDQNLHLHGDHDMLYDEVSVVENDNLLLGSGRLSTDSNCFSFYENLESGLEGESSSDILNSDDESSEPLFHSSKNMNMDTIITTRDLSCNEGPSFSWDNVEGDVRNLKLELKKAMELYHEASREARVSKQKLIELQDWRMKQERMKEVESENAKCNAKIEGEQRLEDEDVEKKVYKEKIKVMIEEEDEWHKVLDALHQSQTILKYHTLFHTFIVLFLSFLYFSSFK